MALAWLWAQDASAGGYSFTADLGTNEYYDYQIGVAEHDPGEAHELAEVAYESPLQPRPPNVNPFNPRFEFQVPAHRFSAHARCIKLTSYRDADRNGPAQSRVVAVVPGLASERGPTMSGHGRRPAMAFSFQEAATRGQTLFRAIGAEPQANPRDMSFEAGQLTTVCGRPRSVYLIDAGLLLRLRTAPRIGPLPRAIVDVMGTIDGDCVVLTKSFRISEVRPDVALGLLWSADELRGVPRHRDIRVTATMRWPAAGRGILSAQASHDIYFTERYVVKQLGRAHGPELSLHDAAQFRGFWNRIWAGPPEGEARRWRMNLVCRYYVRVAVDRDANARVETRLALQDPPDPDGSTQRVEGKLKSGIELSLDQVNSLIPLFGADLLAGDRLAALKSSALRPGWDLEATARLQANGRRDTPAAIWAFPEFSLRDVTLSRLEPSDADGGVREAHEETVQFPFPTSMRFVAVRSV